MIQFNLLPDVKLQYLKARRTSHLVISISVLVTAAALAILIILLGTVYVYQKKTLDDLGTTITQDTAKINNTPNLDKILTIQSQLSVLTSLHNNKPVASRLFGFLEQVTPATASVSGLQISFASTGPGSSSATSTETDTGATNAPNTISITGDASSLAVVDTYADTLKFTMYKIAGSTSSEKNAFSNVVLSSFNVTSSDTTFTLTASFDPTIFDSADNVSLVVPNIISTRSEVDQPTDLFKSHATAQSEQ